MQHSKVPNTIFLLSLSYPYLPWPRKLEKSLRARCTNTKHHGLAACLICLKVALNKIPSSQATVSLSLSHACAHTNLLITLVIITVPTQTAEFIIPPIKKKTPSFWILEVSPTRLSSPGWLSSLYKVCDSRNSVQCLCLTEMLFLLVFANSRRKKGGFFSHWLATWHLSYFWTLKEGALMAKK